MICSFPRKTVLPYFDSMISINTSFSKFTEIVTIFPKGTYYVIPLILLKGF